MIFALCYGYIYICPLDTPVQTQMIERDTRIYSRQKGRSATLQTLKKFLTPISTEVPHQTFVRLLCELFGSG